MAHLKATNHEPSTTQCKRENTPESYPVPSRHKSGLKNQLKNYFFGEKLYIHSWFWFQATGSCRTAPDPRWAKTSPTTSLWVQCPSGSICDHMNSWRLSHSLLRSRMHCSRVGKTDLSTWRDLGMQKLVSVSLFHCPTESTKASRIFIKILNLHDCSDSQISSVSLELSSSSVLFSTYKA